MIHNKKYNNNKIQISGDLKVGNEIVSIQTSEQWSGIEIDFSGKIQIKSLLPEDYMVSSGRNKIIIVKLNFKEESFSELFKYKGIANITKVLMVTKDLQSRILNIDMSSIQLWSNLIGYKKYGEDFVKKDWAYLGENWEDLDFDGNNDRNYYTYRKRVFDKESKTYTQIKELRKK